MGRRHFLLIAQEMNDFFHYVMFLGLNQLLIKN